MLNECKIVTEEWIISKETRRIYGKLFRPADDGPHPAIIMSHGYNGSHENFAADAAFYAERGFLVYTYDFCGGSNRGKSSGKTTEMTLFTEKDDLLTVFEEVSSLKWTDASRIFLMGASQGGMVTTMAAETLQNKVRGMILYYPALCIADNWRDNFPSADEIPKTVTFWGTSLGRIFFTSIRNFYTFQEIGSYPGDVLILHGDKDPIIPMEYMTKAQAVYHHADLIVLKGEAHGFSAKGSNAARKHMLDFILAHC